MLKKGGFPMHLYGQPSINKMFLRLNPLNLKLISLHIIFILFNPKSHFGRNGCVMWVSKHFPHNPKPTYIINL